MPRGTFIPLDPVDLEPRFFGRLSAFDCECPICGYLLQVGHGKPDNKAYSRITSVMTCQHHRYRQRQPIHQFLLGLIAWPLRRGPRARLGRPPDQRPTVEQLAQLRETTRMIFMWRAPKHRGESLNQIESAITTDLDLSIDAPSSDFAQAQAFYDPLHTFARFVLDRLAEGGDMRDVQARAEEILNPRGTST